MQLTRLVSRVSVVTLVALLCVLATPNPAFAEGSTNTSAPAQSSTGPTKPPGPAGGTYTYNTTTGLWENDHYTWDPITQQTKPKQPQDYSYNPSTGMWDTTDWAYNPTNGKYEPNTVSKPTSPLGGTQKPQTAITNPSDNSSSSDSTQPSPPPVTATPQPGVADSQKTTGAFDLFYNSSISTNVTSNAQSGDASVSKNTAAGSALSGDALSMASVFNLLQSSWSDLRDQGFVSFISNIFGDVVGDLMIDPDALAGAKALANTKINDIDINTVSNNQIKNNIDLSAQSGNANITGNTQAGDATSGSATALANVVNMINSIIGSGQSFFGVVNIHGNLDGDILMPDKFLANLLASNAPSATLDTSKLSQADQKTIATLTDTDSITNNTSLTAASGSALVSDNTNAGSATTGAASTKLTIFNLTGKNIVGSDSLLVFVNVLGEWIGMIVNAPAGTTAAALGDVTSQSISNPSNTALNGTSNANITNNISISSASGDANVSHNTSAGNARSGNAAAGVNLANITSSTLNLSNWFGILFINVLGTWHGSFGINTSNGTIITTGSASSAGQPNLATVSTQSPQVFRVVSNNNQISLSRASFTPEVNEAILGSTSEHPSNNSFRGVAPVDVNSSTGGTPTVAVTHNYWIPAIGTLLGAVLLGAERIISVVQRRRLAHA